MHENRNQQVVERLWQAFDTLDFEAAGEVLHDDFIAEWPQSRERMHKDNFLVVNKNYPGTWHITILRIIAEGDQVASEVKIDIDGRTDYAVSFYELRDGKIIKETDYWPEPYEAPAWRARWVEKIELASK
jgi:ketosteroid isomerase-like protein